MALSTSSASYNNPRDTVVPWVLIGVGVAGYVLAAALADAPLAQLLVGLGLLALVQVLLMVGAAYLTAMLTGTSFGDLSTAFVKLAGVVLCAGAVGALIPFGGLLSFFVFLGLMLWLFELEVWQAVVFAIVLWAVQFAVAMVLAAAVAGSR